MAVLSGLNSASVNRLKHTKSGLPSKITSLLEAIEKEMSSMGSFKAYRALLNQNPSAPTIPFMFASSTISFFKKHTHTRTQTQTHAQQTTNQKPKEGYFSRTLPSQKTETLTTRLRD